MAPLDRSNAATKKLKKTKVMGILNVTPDSFSDGGEYLSQQSAINRGLQIEQEGAAILDIGGESSRPFAEAVTTEEEIRRVVPVIQSLTKRLTIPISIDTCKYDVARAALDAGATIINDISALTMSENMLSLTIAYKAQVVLMHMKGTPRTMQQSPKYDDVVGEVLGYLKSRRDYCIAAGLPKESIIVDPGIGFGKTVEHNLLLLKDLHRLEELDCPVLVGASRKSFIGIITNTPVENRLSGSLAAAVIAVSGGAEIIRAHDVSETVQAVQIADALFNERIC